MIRKVPIVATVLVAIAVATMIGLGIWQLDRAQWKGRLIEQYQTAAKLPPRSATRSRMPVRPCPPVASGAPSSWPPRPSSRTRTSIRSPTRRTRTSTRVASA
ncbi:MAG: SURF1 family protein [Gemmatimonadetes bacterium]|nr:SURF1 family protein [Gemmatimonadota bacterium]